MVEDNERREANEAAPNAGDYFLVSTRACDWVVSREMAAHVERAIEAHPMAPWVVFVDHTGARVRLRTALIDYVEQRTAEQRAAARAFRRVRRREEQETNEWEDD